MYRVFSVCLDFSFPEVSLFLSWFPGLLVSPTFSISPSTSPRTLEQRAPGSTTSASEENTQRSVWTLNATSMPKHLLFSSYDHFKCLNNMSISSITKIYTVDLTVVLQIIIKWKETLFCCIFHPEGKKFLPKILSSLWCNSVSLSSSLGIMLISISLRERIKTWHFLHYSEIVASRHVVPRFTIA